MTAAATTLGAIEALFNGSAQLQADFPAQGSTPGGLWVGGVPETMTALPFVALINFHETPNWVFEGNIEQGEGDWSLVVYAVGLANAEQLAAHIRVVFDPSTANGSSGDFVHLAIANATSAWIMRQDYRVRLVEYRAADSSWVYEITMPYKSYVTKTV